MTSIYLNLQELQALQAVLGPASDNRDPVRASVRDRVMKAISREKAAREQDIFTVKAARSRPGSF